jgi:hypothetical protein
MQKAARRRLCECEKGDYCGKTLQAHHLSHHCGIRDLLATLVLLERMHHDQMKFSVCRRDRRVVLLFVSHVGS